MLATLVAGRANQEEGKSTGGQERIRLLGRLARLRRRLATVKAKTTIEYIENAVVQGEKVLAFTCFTAPLQRMAKKFGDRCVVLSGETGCGKTALLKYVVKTLTTSYGAAMGVPMPADDGDSEEVAAHADLTEVCH